MHVAQDKDGNRPKVDTHPCFGVRNPQVKASPPPNAAKAQDVTKKGVTQVAQLCFMTVIKLLDRRRGSEHRTTINH